MCVIFGLVLIQVNIINFNESKKNLKKYIQILWKLINICNKKKTKLMMEEKSATYWILPDEMMKRPKWKTATTALQ